MWRRLVIVVVFVAAACGGRDEGGGDSGTAVSGTGVSHGNITVDGRERSYRLYVPAELPDGRVPLFVGLHGGSGWGDQFVATNGIEAVADREGFVVVHPDGVDIGGGRRAGGVWNGGVCCGVAAREDVDDVAYIEALLDRLEADHDIDPGRVYAFGHSNGGIMSYRLACELADRIVGIGVVAGTLGVNACEPSAPVSVLHVHGDADENLPIEGGEGPRSVAGVDFPSPRDGFEVLAAANGCPAAEPDVTTDRRTPCDSGTEAVFIALPGAQHPWPGTDAPTRPGSGDPFTAYDATTELVDFLLAHPRPRGNEGPGGS